MFDLATFDRFFETMLRNKGNMFLVGTVPLPGQLPPPTVCWWGARRSTSCSVADEKSIALASRRGLVIIQHQCVAVVASVGVTPHHVHNECSQLS